MLKYHKISVLSYDIQEYYDLLALTYNMSYNIGLIQVTCNMEPAGISDIQQV